MKKSSKEKAIVLDIGNRTAKIYVTIGNELGARWIFSSRTEDWISHLEQIAARSGSREAVVVSVIPDATEMAKQLLVSLGINAIFVHGEMALPIKLEYASPARLGADRIATAVGACVFYGEQNDEIVVVDAGTAITVDFIRKDKFMGGAILPGIDLFIESLHKGTAKLPGKIAFKKPQFPGRGTEQCILAGAVAAISGGIDFLWHRYTHGRGNVRMLLTGGDAERMESFIKIPFTKDPFLLLKGAIAILDFTKSLESEE